MSFKIIDFEVGSSYSESSVESRKFQPTPPAFGASVGGDAVPSFAEIFCVRKLESWAITRHRLRDPTFSHFSRTPTCEWQTDRQTHDDSIYRASMALRGKKRYAVLR